MCVNWNELQYLAFVIILQVAELASLAQLLLACSPTCVIRRWTALCQSCCSPIASASAAARRLHRSASTAAPRLRPLPAASSGPDCGIRFNCCTPFASASSRLRPLQLLHARRLRVRFSCCSRSLPLRLLLPDCVRFNCCSPIALAGFQPMPWPCPGPMFSNILRGVRGSVNKLKYEGRASL